MDFYHLRALHGRTEDLLIGLKDGLVAVKIKSSARVSRADARQVRNLQPFLDKRFAKPCSSRWTVKYGKGKPGFSRFLRPGRWAATKAGIELPATSAICLG